MSTGPDFDRHASAWLADGPSELADRVLDAALREVHRTHQRRRRAMPWRTPLMSIPIRATAAIAIVAVAGVLALAAFRPTPNGAPNPTSPTAAPTSNPTPSAAAEASPGLDVREWTTYTSSLYGFTIAHPPGWQEIPATRRWSFGADGNDWLSPGMEAFFTSDNGGTRVSAWAVAAGFDMPGDPDYSDIEAWIDDYCLKINDAPCVETDDPPIQLCVEFRDCHTSGLLVTSASEVQAFFTSGIYGDQMVIVSVWWGESEPSTAPYGGSRRLLEGFLSTMNVWDASIDRSGRIPPTPAN